MKAAIYAWVSTRDQEPENQRADLRRSLAARGWSGVEYVDRGVTPNNMPSFIVNDQFTAKDIVRAEAKRDDRFARMERTVQDVTCPHCGKDFGL